MSSFTLFDLHSSLSPLYCYSNSENEVPLFGLSSLVKILNSLTHTDSGDFPMASARPREDDELQDERAPKRFKPSEDEPHQADAVAGSRTTGENSQGQLHIYNLEDLLPPSRELLGLPPTSQKTPDGVVHRTSEPDVGISEYIGKGLPAIQGIIKQRYECPWDLSPVPALTSLISFTDFLVFEVDLNHTVTRLRCIGRPVVTMETESSKEEPATAISQEEWPTSFTLTLEQFLSAEKVEALKSLYSEGPAPLLSSATVGNGQETPSESGARPNEGSSNRNSTARRGQGKRGKYGKDKRSTQVAADNRQVVSNVSRDIATSVPWLTVITK